MEVQAVVRQKNNAVQLYRIVCTLIICLHHFQGAVSINLMHHGYVCVEFFFILSGYFLYNSFKKEETHSCRRYIGKRIKRLYPEYLLAAIVMVIMEIISSHELSAVKAVPEILMIQATGIFTGGYNAPCWYLSVIMFLMPVIYAALSEFENIYIKFIIPTAVVLGYTYIFNLESGLESWQVSGAIYPPVIRGFAGLNIGVFLAYIRQRGGWFKIKSPCVWGYILELLCVLCIGISIFGQENTDRLALIAFVILIAVITNEYGLSNIIKKQRLIEWGGGLSYALYLNHAAIIKVMRVIGEKLHMQNMYALIICYMLMLIIYSICTHYFCMYIQKRIYKL